MKHALIFETIGFDKNVTNPRFVSLNGMWLAGVPVPGWL